MTIKPFDRERIIKWMRNTSTDKLESNLEGAIRAGNTPRADLLRATLERRTAPRPAKHRPAVKTRQTPRLCDPWHPIAEQVAQRHGIAVRDMLSGWREPRLVQARHEFWWRLHRRGVALAEIGRRCGGYDHTSVRHGVLKMEEKMQVEVGAA